MITECEKPIQQRVKRQQLDSGLEQVHCFGKSFCADQQIRKLLEGLRRRRTLLHSTIKTSDRLFVVLLFEGKSRESFENFDVVRIGWLELLCEREVSPAILRIRNHQLPVSLQEQ